MALEGKFVDKLSRQAFPNFKLFDQKVTEVGTTAEKVPGTAMDYRKCIILYNDESSGTYVWLGASDVTADSTEATGGMKLNGGDYMVLELDGSVDLYGRSASGNVTVHTLELG